MSETTFLYHEAEQVLARRYDDKLVMIVTNIPPEMVGSFLTSLITNPAELN